VLCGGLKWEQRPRNVETDKRAASTPYMTQTATLESLERCVAIRPEAFGSVSFEGCISSELCFVLRVCPITCGRYVELEPRHGHPVPAVGAELQPREVVGKVLPLSFRRWHIGSVNFAYIYFRALFVGSRFSFNPLDYKESYVCTAASIGVNRGKRLARSIFPRGDAWLALSLHERVSY
jgi:hypothetical protein